jgi:hypothetical protein
MKEKQKRKEKRITKTKNKYKRKEKESQQIHNRKKNIKIGETDTSCLKPCFGV